MNGEALVRQLAADVGGTIEELEHLPDGSGFAVMSMPLKKDHWIYGDASVENHREDFSYEPPPMPMRMGTEDPFRVVMAEMIEKAGRYAVRASTMKGKEMDFDPDALVRNLVIGMFGYYTPDGLTDDEWANPPNA